MSALPSVPEMVDALDRIAEAIAQPYVDPSDILDEIEDILHDVNR